MAIVCAVASAFAFMERNAAARPPYATDDPEPVEYRHWEIYVASQTSKDAKEFAATVPLVEANYGVVPELQLHLVAPLEVHVPREGPRQLGYGDTEVGAKLRFVRETELVPQIGVFPLAELPTGSKERGLGTGTVRIFLPLWLQKSVGAWTTSGGAGYWIHPGERSRNWVFVGWYLERRLSAHLTVGAEIFHLTAQGEAASSETRVDVGSIIDLTELHHLLASLGRGITGPTSFQSYLAYLITFGPT